ncbi:MAG: hypothetical protein MJ139_05575, partial [Limosilactobacillus sp.]|nr:hypothetical protein [Limosilactobacillus sp.]
YIWVDNDGEQIQHPFVVASYDANLPVTGAFGTTAAKNDIPVDANAATNLNNGLTYTAKDGKVTVAGGYTADVFKTKSDLYTTNTVIDVNGKKFITDNSQALTIAGVNHVDNQEVPTHAWNQPVTEQEVIDAIQALRGDNTIISYAVKGGQAAIPTSGSHQAVTVIATLPSNGVDANGNALPGETKELTVYVSYTPSQASENTPTADTLEKTQNAPVTDTEIINQVKGIPAGTQVTVDDPSQLTTLTAQPGSKTVPVTVKYVDGSVDHLNVSVNVSEVAADVHQTQPGGRYFWSDQGIEHPFVLSEYNPAATGVTETYLSSAGNPNMTAKLNTGLTITPDNGKVVISGNFSSPVFQKQTDQYAVNTVMNQNGHLVRNTEDEQVAIVGVKHEDNQVVNKGYGATISNDDIINALKGKVIFNPNQDLSLDRYKFINDLKNNIQYEVKPGQTLPTSGKNNVVKVIATLPSNGVDANGNALLGETKELTVVVNFADPQSDSYEPKGQDVAAHTGDTPSAADGISNKDDLPQGTKYEWKETPDTKTGGDKPATVVVTYPDGSSEEVNVTV